MKLSNGWQFEVERTPYDFVEGNIALYSQKYIEEYPERAHLINDGEIEIVIDWMVEENMEELKETMAECYFERLGENWD